MSDTKDWFFPEALRPDRAALDFDLNPLLDAVLQIRTEVPDDAFTAETLGTERGGNAVLIEPGLALTIGYLITEATTVWLTSRTGFVVPAYPLAYDQATGFGLVRALAPLPVEPIPMGRSAELARDDSVIVLSHGGWPHALSACIADKREFAGYWEYLIEDALFTHPAHPEWSGAALINQAGELVGIGSLLTQQLSESEPEQGNLFVPIDLLAPILQSLTATGASGLPPRPWLGLYAGETEAGLLVGSLSQRGPAARAGLQADDLILEVSGQRVRSLAELYRAVWQIGPAGVSVPMTIARGGELIRLNVVSVDRASMLRQPVMH
jgi:S1-C subfamily serine protease